MKSSQDGAGPPRCGVVLGLLGSLHTYAPCRPLRRAQTPSLGSREQRTSGVTFHLAEASSFFLYLCGSGGSVWRGARHLTNSGVGNVFAGNQRKGKILLPTIPHMLPRDLSLWKLNSFPLCCGWLGAHIVDATAHGSEVPSSFLLQKCHSNCCPRTAAHT